MMSCEISWVSPILPPILPHTPFRAPHWLFCLDVLLHQLGDDFVFGREFLFELGDLGLFGLLFPAWAPQSLKRLLGLIEYSF